MSLRRLLNNQSGQFWGGFLGGLNQSMKEGRERSDKHKELELRKKQIDAQIKGMDADNEIKQHTLKQKMAELGSREELAKTFEGTPDNYQSPDFQNPENVTSLRDQMLPSKSTPGTPGDPRQAAMVRAGLGKEAVAQQPKSWLEQYQEYQMANKVMSGQSDQQPGAAPTSTPTPQPGIKFGPKGQAILVPHGEEKTPFRADDATYRSLMKKHNGNFEAARAEYDVMIGRTAKERSFQGATGTGQARQELPLSASDSGTLGVPFGTTAKQAQGANALTASARNTLTSMASAESVLSQIGELSNKINTASDATQRAWQTPGAIFGTLAQTDTERNLYQSLTKGMLAAFSRSVGGERGATTEQDVARAEQLLPKVYPFPDTKAVAQGKLKQLRELITEIKSRTRSGDRAQNQPSQQGGAKQGRLTPLPGN